eukprot:2324288-Rhodomonas_salina.2
MLTPHLLEPEPDEYGEVTQLLVGDSSLFPSRQIFGATLTGLLQSEFLGILVPSEAATEKRDSATRVGSGEINSTLGSPAQSPTPSDRRIWTQEPCPTRGRNSLLHILLVRCLATLGTEWCDLDWYSSTGYGESKTVVARGFGYPG